MNKDIPGIPKQRLSVNSGNIARNKKINPMWGTDNEWRIVAIGFGIEDENPRIKLVKYLDENPDERNYGKIRMEDNGIWEQALQVAKENDLNIQP